MTPEKHKIINRDGALLEVEAADVGDAGTLAHMAGDLPHAHDAMPDCTGLDHSRFLRYLPRAKEIANQKKNQGPLAHESVQNLAAIAISADYYDSPDILKKSIGLLAQKLAYQKEVEQYFDRHGTFSFELPPLVNAAVVKKFIKMGPYIKVVLLEEQRRREERRRLGLRTELLPDAGGAWSTSSFADQKLTFLNSPMRLAFATPKMLKIMSIRTGEAVWLSDPLLGNLETATITHDNLMVVTSHHKEDSFDNKYAVACWNAKDGRQLQLWKHDQEMSLVGNSKAGIIVKLQRGELCILNDRSTTFQPHNFGTSNVVCMARANKDLLCSGSDQGEIALWDLSRVSKITALNPYHGNSVTALACHPQKDRIFASGGNCGIIYLLELDSHSPCTLLTHTSGDGRSIIRGGVIHSLAFNSEGDLLASGSEDRTASVWSVPLRQCLTIITVHKSPIMSVSFSPTGDLLVSKDSDKKLGITTLFDGMLQKNIEQMHLDSIGLIARLGKRIREGRPASIHDKKQFKHLCDNLPESLADLVRENMSYYDKMAFKYEHFKERVLM